MESTESPRSTAFLARSPAASMTDGFEVLVQEVMAAITTDPFRSVEDFGFWISDFGFLGKGSGVGRSEIISCSSEDIVTVVVWAS